MSRCPQCFGPNDDAGYSHLCHACLVALEPTPQEQKVAPPVDGQSKSAFTPSNGDTPAVVGLEPVAFMTHHDEPMLFPTWDEAAQYCDDDESPISLFHTADVARLQSELTEWRGQAHRSQSDADRLQAENEHLRGSIEVLRDRIEALRKQNAKNEDDAARYRWLREKGGAVWHIVDDPKNPKRATGAYYDAAVDDAMKTPNV